MYEKVAVIIPTYQNREGLLKCLDSIHWNFYDNIICVIVNNNTEPLKVKPTTKGATVFIIENRKNLGFAAACNKGAEMAILKHEARYLFFLNDDCIVQKNTIGQLVAELEFWPYTAGVSPIIRDRRSKIWFAGGKMNRVLGYHRHYHELPWISFNTDYLTGAAAMFKSCHWPGFSERYFMYFEDADVSLSLRRSGYSLKVVQSAVVLHGISSTIGWWHKWRLQFRSGLLFHGKNSKFNVLAYIGFTVFMVLKGLKHVLYAISASVCGRANLHR